MRRVLLYLFVMGLIMLAFAVLLPLIGVVLLIAAAGIGLLMAAPLLARLPWFRNWIRVERHGARRTVRFGSGAFTSYRPPEGSEPFSRPSGNLERGDVIDVEGREVPERDRDD